MGQVLKLDVIVDEHGATRTLKGVEDQIERVGGATRRTTPSLNDASTSLASLTTVVMRYASAAAVLAAVKGTLAMASSLDKMRASTDIGFKGLQQLENIAVGSNTTLQALTSSILDMQRKLVSGDEGAVGAVRALGFNLQAFMNLKGDEQFVAVAKALGAMEHEVQRNKLAFDLFGRSFKEINAALTSDVDALKNSVTIMTDQQIRDVARIEAEWQKLILTAKRYALMVTALGSNAALSTFAPSADDPFGNKTLPALPKPPRGQMFDLSAPGVPSAVDMVAINFELARGLDLMKDQTQAAAELDAAVERLTSTWYTNTLITLKGLTDLDAFHAREQQAVDALFAKEQAMTQAIWDNALASDAANAAMGTFNGSLERGAAIAGAATDRFAGLTAMIGATQAQMTAFYDVVGQRNSVGGHAQSNIGTPGILSNTRPAGSWFTPSATAPTFGAGAITVNYPVMNDTRAMDELGRMIDAAVSQRLSGARL